MLQAGLPIAAPESANTAVQGAAGRVVSGLPADQALGLRLLALARAAAATHMAQSASSYLAHSQAASLVKEVR